MGCKMCKDLFEPIAVEMGPVDVVGGAGTVKSVNLDEVPNERKSMAELVCTLVCVSFF